ncbi:MAG: hypothetical protein ICV60_09780 [Pyrinomonadaceae bacterium]|nr:hypothetical protein [Pyrinomonadaceae bacterium]
MDSRKRIPPGRGANHVPARQPFQAQVGLRSIVQPKIATAAPVKKQPVAPPAYRPQPTPKGLQQKSAPVQRKVAGHVGSSPQAPPAYRPQPTPKVLQTKTARATPTSNRPAALPPPRPQVSKSVQPRMAQQEPKRSATLQPRNVVQRITVVNHYPDWRKDTVPRVKALYHAQVNLTRDFGVGVEPAFQCPGCHRVLPLAIATINHKIGKKRIREFIATHGANAPAVMDGESFLNWSRVDYLSDGTNQGTQNVGTPGNISVAGFMHLALNDLENLEPMCNSCNSEGSHCDDLG